MTWTCTTTSELTIMDCCSCGITHAIPNILYNKSKNDGSTWRCPNGHVLQASGKSDKSKLKDAQREADALRDQVALEQEQNRRLEKRRQAQLAATTRLKNRAKHGVCPCCSRSFKQLAAHMKNKHPEFVKSK